MQSPALELFFYSENKENKNTNESESRKIQKMMIQSGQEKISQSQRNSIIREKRQKMRKNFEETEQQTKLQTQQSIDELCVSLKEFKKNFQDTRKIKNLLNFQKNVQKTIFMDKNMNMKYFECLQYIMMNRDYFCQELVYIAVWSLANFSCIDNSSKVLRMLVDDIYQVLQYANTLTNKSQASIIISKCVQILGNVAVEDQVFRIESLSAQSNFPKMLCHILSIKNKALFKEIIWMTGNLVKDMNESQLQFFLQGTEFSKIIEFNLIRYTDDHQILLEIFELLIDISYQINNYDFISSQLIVKIMEIGYKIPNLALQIFSRTLVANVFTIPSFEFFLDYENQDFQKYLYQGLESQNMYLKRETLLLVSNIAFKLPIKIFQDHNMMQVISRDFFNLNYNLSIEYLFIIHNIFKDESMENVKKFMMSNQAYISTIQHLINNQQLIDRYAQQYQQTFIYFRTLINQFNM